MSLRTLLQRWLGPSRPADHYPHVEVPRPAPPRRLSLSDFPYLDERDTSPLAFVQRRGVPPTILHTTTEDPDEAPKQP